MYLSLGHVVRAVPRDVRKQAPSPRLALVPPVSLPHGLTPAGGAMGWEHLEIREHQRFSMALYTLALHSGLD